MIPRHTVIKVPVFESDEPYPFTVTFTDEMLFLRTTTAADSGIRFITICVLESNIFSASPFCGVAILHPRDYHNETIANRLAFKRAVLNFVNSIPFEPRKEKATWDMFRRALWQANHQSVDPS